MSSVCELKEKIEEGLESYLHSGSSFDEYQLMIVEASRYAVFGPASRRRSLLVMLGAELFDYDPYEKVLPVACGVEFCHTASLIFDDLPQQDNALERRGKPALHVEFDEYTAQLAGIYLNNLCYDAAFDAVRHFPPERVIEAIRGVMDSAGIDGLVAGQMQDLRLGSGNTLTPTKLEELYLRKTANFVGAAVRSPAVLYGSSPEVQFRLYNYGRFMGLALQFRDDLNSVESANDDGKLTAVTVLGREAAERTVSIYRNRALAELGVFGSSADRLRDAAVLVSEQVS